MEGLAPDLVSVGFSEARGSSEYVDARLLVETLRKIPLFDYLMPDVVQAAPVPELLSHVIRVYSQKEVLISDASFVKEYARVGDRVVSKSDLKPASNTIKKGDSCVFRGTLSDNKAFVEREGCIFAVNLDELVRAPERSVFGLIKGSRPLRKAGVGKPSYDIPQRYDPLLYFGRSRDSSETEVWVPEGSRGLLYSAHLSKNLAYVVWESEKNDICQHNQSVLVGENVFLKPQLKVSLSDISLVRKLDVDLGEIMRACTRH